MDVLTVLVRCHRVVMIKLKYLVSKAKPKILTLFGSMKTIHEILVDIFNNSLDIQVFFRDFKSLNFSVACRRLCRKYQYKT